jgi:hypothetical protein
MKTCAASYKDVFLNCTSSVFGTAGFSIYSIFSSIKNNYFSHFWQ